jgi:hypothetical protein
MYEEANNPNSIIIECDCYDREHIMYIDIDIEEKEVVFCKKYNSYLPWYKRVIKAVQYIFKYNPRYMWETSVIHDPTKIDKLIEMLSKIKETIK